MLFRILMRIPGLGVLRAAGGGHRCIPQSAVAAGSIATAQVVALGSSYAAGPGIAPIETGNPASCALE